MVLARMAFARVYQGFQENCVRKPYIVLVMTAVVMASARQTGSAYVKLPSQVMRVAPVWDVPAIHMAFNVKVAANAILMRKMIRLPVVTAFRGSEGLIAKKLSALRQSQALFALAMATVRTRDHS